MNDNYLNEKLLPVFTPEEEKEFLAKKEQPEAVKTIVEHNLRLVCFIVKKYQNTNIDKNDLISIGTIGLIKAVKSYKLEKNVKFATYAAKCIHNEILMSIRENKKSSKDQYLSEVILIDQNGKELKIEDILADKRVNADDTNEQEMLEILSDALTIALNKLELREKIILLLSLAGKKQDEICKQLDLSQFMFQEYERK